MELRPLIGISACLLGESVRYDGGHKLDRYLRDQLGAMVDYVSVCPEVECGLGVPREAMRLVDDETAVRLMTNKTGIDITPKMEAWMSPRLDELATLPLCGFIFKAKSPSSGWKRVKVYGGKLPRHDGTGIFAKGFTERFPLLPVEEEGRLHDARLRENFITRIFVMQRWRCLVSKKKTVGALMTFHASHKYLLMAHDVKTLKQLGALVAAGRTIPVEDLYQHYFELMMPAISKLATVKKNTNVLDHIMGYFKKQLDADEKCELKEIIERYHAGLVPLVVPITLINHYVRKYQPVYLQNQIYLNPHPLELMLMNHV